MKAYTCPRCEKSGVDPYKLGYEQGEDEERVCVLCDGHGIITEGMAADYASSKRTHLSASLIARARWEEMVALIDEQEPEPVSVETTEVPF